MTILFKRLTKVSDMIIKGEPVADIGADHALLSIYLIEKQIAPRVIIGELRDGPFNRARQAVQTSSWHDKIDLRQGNGLQILNSGEVASVVLAGLGGDTIVDILADDWEKAASFKRFVFQPMSKTKVLRQQLASRGWIIEEECLEAENGRIFLVMATRPGNCPYSLTDLEMEIGSSILNADNELKRVFIGGYISKYKRIYNNIRQSHLPANRVLAQDYRDRIARLEEILSASQG